MPPQKTLREGPGSIDLVVRRGRRVWTFVVFMGLIGLAPASFLIAVFVVRAAGGESRVAYLPTAGMVHGVLVVVLLALVQVRCVLRVEFSPAEIPPTWIRLRRPLWSRRCPVSHLGAITVTVERCRPAGATVHGDADRDPASGKLNWIDMILHRPNSTVWCHFTRTPNDGLSADLTPDGAAVAARLRAILAPAEIPVRHVINWSDWDPEWDAMRAQWDRNPSL